MFKDRSEAGRLLAESLSFLKGAKDVVVLAVPRGGVIVAKEIADSIGSPLDLVIVRKIGAPGNPELAVGAVTQDGQTILDLRLIRATGASDDYIKEESARQSAEISRRMREYRGDRPYPRTAGKTMVLVDDGIATGSTVRAAIQSLRKTHAGKIILAVPVGARETILEMSKIADKIVCLRTPTAFHAIGEFYEDFEQVTDGAVRAALGEG